MLENRWKQTIHILSLIRLHDCIFEECNVMYIDTSMHSTPEPVTMVSELNLKQSTE